MRVAGPGEARAKAAATAFRVLERFASLAVRALVECLPETGRTHQIRVHLAHAGAPLCLDPDYGPKDPLRDESGRILLDRTPLHAASLALRHPATGAPLRLEAPLPGDMARLVAWARAVADG
jgi:tRNA pseudouridine32 synthase/23S rRNA pseudouridine746 synthase